MNYRGIDLCDHCFMTLENGVCTSCGGERERAACALPCGTVLNNKYIVGKVLGKGGFGITYLAFDRENGTRMVVKEFYPNAIICRESDNATARVSSKDKTEQFENGKERFYQEAKMVHDFSGVPGMVEVYDFFNGNNTVYFTMEYLEGSDLNRYTKKNGGKLPESEVLRILVEVCRSLREVHKKNVLHRDISPENIFICNDGSVKLIDFGAARHVFTEGEQSNSLSIILKMGYAPIEQYQRKGKQGPWTDIYALGATLYVCLTGNSFQDAPSRIDDPAISFPTGVVISRRTKNVILKMTAVEHFNRYQSVDELFAALDDRYDAKLPSAGGTYPAQGGQYVPNDRAPRVGAGMGNERSVRQQANNGVQPPFAAAVPYGGAKAQIDGEAKRVVLASSGARVGSFFLDLLFDYIIYFVLAGVILSLMGSEASVMLVVVAIAIFLVKWLAQGVKGHGTLGQRALGITLVDKDGFSIGAGRALGRTLSMLLTSVTMGIGYIIMFSSAKRQTLHDRLSGVYAVKVLGDVIEPIPPFLIIEPAPVPGGVRQQYAGAGGGYHMQGGGGYVQTPVVVPRQSSTTSLITATGGILGGRRYSVGTQKVLVGRDATVCGIAFPNDTHGVSRRHCSLRTVPTGVMLVDEGSTYGTFLDNGIRLEPGKEYLLREGDGFYLAALKYRFEVGAR